MTSQNVLGVMIAWQLVLLPFAVPATGEDEVSAEEMDEVKKMVDADFNPLAELGRERRRQRLFDAVTAAAPADLKPEYFSGTHGMQQPHTPNR